jgi:hypothetical protein
MKLYRGDTSRDRRLVPIRRGCLPKFTWLTTSRKEAVKYARLKVKGGHGAVAGGEAVLVTVELPEVDGVAWRLGGIPGADYYKTFKRVCPKKVSIREL